MNPIIKYKANGVCYDVQRFSFTKSRQKPTAVIDEIYEFQQPPASPMMQLSLKFEPFYRTGVLHEWFFFVGHFASFPGVLTGQSPDPKTLKTPPKPRLRESVEEEFVVISEYSPIPPALEQLARGLEPYALTSKFFASLPAHLPHRQAKKQTAFTLSINQLESVLELFAKYPQLDQGKLRVSVNFYEESTFDSQTLSEFYKISQVALFYPLGSQLQLNAAEIAKSVKVCAYVGVRSVFLHVLAQYNGIFLGEALFLVDFKFYLGQQQLLYLKFGEMTHTAVVSYQIEFDELDGVNLLQNAQPRLQFPVLNNQLLRRNNRFVPVPESRVYLYYSGKAALLCSIRQNFTACSPFQLNCAFSPLSLLFSHAMRPEPGSLLFAASNLQQIANFGAYFLDFGENACAAEFSLSDEGGQPLICYGHVDFDYVVNRAQLCEFYGGAPGCRKMTGMQLVLQIVAGRQEKEPEGATKSEQRAQKADNSSSAEWRYLAFKSAVFRWLSEECVLQHFLLDTTANSAEICSLVKFYYNEAHHALICDDIQPPPALATAAAKIETAFLQPPTSNVVFSALALGSLRHFQKDFYKDINDGVSAETLEPRQVSVLENSFYSHFAMSYKTAKIYGRDVPKAVQNIASELVFPHLQVPFPEICEVMAKEVVFLLLSIPRVTKEQPCDELRFLDVSCLFTSNLNAFESIAARALLVLKFLNTLLVVKDNQSAFYGICDALIVSDDTCISEDISQLLHAFLEMLQNVKLENCGEVVSVVTHAFRQLRTYTLPFVDVIARLSKDVLYAEEFQSAFKRYFSAYLEENKERDLLFLCNQIFALKLKENYFAEVIQPYYVYNMLRVLRNEQPVDDDAFDYLMDIQFYLFDGEQLQMLFLVLYYLLNRVDSIYRMQKVVCLLLRVIPRYTQYDVNYELLDGVCSLAFTKLQALPVTQSSELVSCMQELLCCDYVKKNCCHVLFAPLLGYLAKQIASLQQAYLPVAKKLFSLLMENVGPVQSYHYRLMTLSFGRFLENDLAQRKLVLFLDEQFKVLNQNSFLRAFWEQVKQYNETLRFLAVNVETARRMFNIPQMKQALQNAGDLSNEQLLELYMYQFMGEFYNALTSLLAFYRDISDVKFHIVCDVLILLSLQAHSLRAVYFIEEKTRAIERGLPDVYFMLRILYMYRQHLVNDNPEIGCFPFDASLFPNFPLPNNYSLRAAFVHYCGGCKVSNFVLEQDMEQIAQYFANYYDYMPNIVQASLESIPRALLQLRADSDDADFSKFRGLALYLPTHFPYFSRPQPIPSTALFRNQCIQAGFLVKTLPKIQFDDLTGASGLSALQRTYLQQIGDFLRFTLAGLRRLVLIDYSHTRTTLSASLEGVLTCWLCDDFLQRISRHYKDVLRYLDVCVFDERTFETFSCSAPSFDSEIRRRLAARKVINVGLVFQQQFCIAGKETIFFVAKAGDNNVSLLELESSVFSYLCVKCILQFLARENAALLRCLIPRSLYDLKQLPRPLFLDYMRALRDHGLVEFEPECKDAVDSDEDEDSSGEDASSETSDGKQAGQEAAAE